MSLMRWTISQQPSRLRRLSKGKRPTEFSYHEIKVKQIFKLYNLKMRGYI